MELIVGGKSPDRLDQKLYKKYLILADKIGDIIYNRKNISKDNIIKALKSKKEQIRPKQSKMVNIPELVKSYFKKKERDPNKPIDVVKERRKLGMVVLSSITLIIIAIVLYIISNVVDWLLSIMEWWVLFVLVFVMITPLVLAIAFYMAVHSNEEVYNMKQ